jgi:hypothetical protein
MCMAAAPVLAGPTLTGAPLVGTGFGATFGLPASLTTLGSAFTALSAVGTAVQTIGVIRQSRAASGQAAFKAGIARNNAIIAENNAQIALQKGEADVADKKRETRQRIGLQRAQLAAAGFSVSEGSSIDILGDTAALGELDVLRIDTDAKNRAANFRGQSANFQAESDLGRLAVKSKKKAGNLKAASSLISGASKTGTTFLATRP